MKRALVVFVGQTELKKLWVLKRGYRHCFALIEGRAGWAICQLASKTDHLLASKTGQLAVAFDLFRAG